MKESTDCCLRHVGMRAFKTASLPNMDLDCFVHKHEWNNPVSCNCEGNIPKQRRN